MTVPPTARHHRRAGGAHTGRDPGGLRAAPDHDAGAVRDRRGVFVQVAGPPASYDAFAKPDRTWLRHFPRSVGLQPSFQHMVLSPNAPIESTRGVPTQARMLYDIVRACGKTTRPASSDLCPPWPLAVPAVHRARDHQLLPGRYLQRGWVRASPSPFAALPPCRWSSA
jgi:hypothetical protein